MLSHRSDTDLDVAGSRDLAALSPAQAHAAVLSAFRAQRVRDLMAEDGWLTVIGLEWLETGDNRIGSGADNDIVLLGGPARLGIVTVTAGGETSIALDPAADATIGGEPLRQARLVDSEEDYHHPTVVRYGVNNFYIVDRDGRKGLRIKDNRNAARREFPGLEYFDVDLAWRVEADWVPLDPPREMLVATGWGNISTKIAKCKAVFSRDGKTYELFPVPNQNTDLMFVLADRTSGRETYGACRFLVGELAGDGKIVLDFNKAVNPPCAFSAFATCPIAPPENRLTLRITAGEKTYKSHR